MNDNVTKINQAETINGATFAELLGLSQRGTATILNKIHENAGSGWSAKDYNLTLEEAKDYLTERNQGYTQAGKEYRREARRWLLKEWFTTRGNVKDITKYEESEFKEASGEQLYNGRSAPDKAETENTNVSLENRELRELVRLLKRYG